MQWLVVFVLPVCWATAQGAGVEVGALAGAAYRIDLPANYNGTLVMYCHGYGEAGKFAKDAPLNPFVKALVQLGYAVAQSGYSSSGWAVKEAIDDTEALRRHFVEKYGQPKRTLVTGHSLGGLITVATIETFPSHYDAALPLCAPTGPAMNVLQRRVFDTLVVYDYYFPEMIGSPVDPVEPDHEFAVRIQKEATAYPDRLAAFQQWSGFESDVEVGQVVAFYAILQRELIQRLGGNAFDNRETKYQGSPDDGLLNRGVKRYTADPRAADYLKKYYTPTGQLKRPMLSLHNSYDPVVPLWSANEYPAILHPQGDTSLYQQRVVKRSGHCAFTPEEAVGALQELLRWKETGLRPAGKENK